MAQWRNTAYTEKAPENPNEKWGAGNSSMTRQFDIFDGSFQGRVQAALDLIGYAVVVETYFGSDDWYIHRITPMPYGGLDPNVYMQPIFGDSSPIPDIRNRFYIQGISRTEPLGAMQGVNLIATPDGTAAANYKRARLTCELSTLPYWVKDDAAVTVPMGGSSPLAGFPDEGYYLERGWQGTRYVIRNIKPFSRILKLPFGLMQVKGPIPTIPQLTKQVVPFREGGANVSYTWMRVPLEGGAGGGGLNYGTIAGSLGTINNANFDVFTQFTLYLDTFETREYQGAFGERLADVTYNMIYLPHPSTGNSGMNVAGKNLGWNYVLDMIVGKIDYYEATQPDGMTNAYRATDFASLFRP